MMEVEFHNGPADGQIRAVPTDAFGNPPGVMLMDEPDLQRMEAYYKAVEKNPELPVPLISHRYIYAAPKPSEGSPKPAYLYTGSGKR